MPDEPRLLLAVRLRPLLPVHRVPLYSRRRSMTELAILTAAEEDHLAELESTISAGLRTFVEVGNALSAIRDNKLYRADHSTFEEYCADRWAISRPRAYELMTAAEVVSGIPDTLPQPANAGQATALARVPESERIAVWQAANEATDGKPTAAAIRAAATPDRPFAPGEVPAQGLAAAAGTAAPEAPEGVCPPTGAGDTTPTAPAGKPGVVGADFDKALDQLVPDPEPYRPWRAAYLGHIEHGRYPLVAGAEMVAEAADEECIDELRRLAEDVAAFYERVCRIRREQYGDNVIPLRRVQ